MASSLIVSSLLFLVLLAIVPNVTYSYQTYEPVMEIPGLTVGSVVLFHYKGYGLSRVTLAIEDSNGQGLHLELRDNDGCEEGESSILMNTITNNKFDSEVLESFSGINGRSLQYWSVTAEEDSYKIEHLEKIDNGGGYKVVSTDHFSYRPHHELNDVSKVKLYAKANCNHSHLYFFGEIIVERPLTSEFSKIIIELGGGLRLMSSSVVPSVSFMFSNDEYITLRLLDGYLLIRAYTMSEQFHMYVELMELFTNDTVVHTTLEKLPGSKYRLTVLISSQEYEKIFVTSEQLTKAVLKFGKILKFVIE